MFATKYFYIVLKVVKEVCYSKNGNEVVTGLKGVVKQCIDL